jgi:MFS transporter, DHA2 family, multidrug resistance protein
LATATARGGPSGAGAGAGMASGTADLQRDLGGAIMQSVLGALLTTGCARAVAQAPHHQQITASVQNQLEKSYAGAEAVAQRYPQYASQITAAGPAARPWPVTSGAYSAAILAVLVGAALVFFLFPQRAAG